MFMFLIVGNYFNPFAGLASFIKASTFGIQLTFDHMFKSQPLTERARFYETSQPSKWIKKISYSNCSSRQAFLFLTHAPYN